MLGQCPPDKDFAIMLNGRDLEEWTLALADIIGSYRASLVEQDIPPELADGLSAQLNHAVVTNVLGFGRNSTPHTILSWAWRTEEGDTPDG